MSSVTQSALSSVEFGIWEIADEADVERPGMNSFDHAEQYGQQKAVKIQLQTSLEPCIGYDPTDKDGHGPGILNGVLRLNTFGLGADPGLWTSDRLSSISPMLSPKTWISASGPDLSNSFVDDCARLGCGMSVGMVAKVLVR